LRPVLAANFPILKYCCIIKCKLLYLQVKKKRRTAGVIKWGR
jgi:hypothetical protein